MKKSIILFGLLVACLSSCKTTNWEMPAEYLGTWNSAKQTVIVRTYEFGDGFSFTKDSAVFSLTIDKNKTASGVIGATSFNNAPINPNKPNTDFSGISYIIKCGEIGKIFPGDPLPKKEVELWLMPVKGSALEAELRYTEGMAVFPMAGIKLVRKY